ncbi:hypothetical protein M514_28069 [Trichuris suis]|uniref:Uncharacterized protein n=1 Tax=Trichuris suis TaxID=68888 RepID=A0A085MRA3_9BILA|nr:hypothetical protein M514_28069 [Trichuris suis]
MSRSLMPWMYGTTSVGRPSCRELCWEGRCMRFCMTERIKRCGYPFFKSTFSMCCSSVGQGGIEVRR